jgi:N6-L-threonylcarbamoyladenine synthase
MKILAIETSCDETAVALLDITGPKESPDIKILANNLLSQIDLHQQYGGVYPNLAKREHQKNLPILLEKTLKEAGEDQNNPNIDSIAVTAGPGLEPALWVGITIAEELGKRWGKPVIPINHMEGHIFSVLYNIDDAGLKLPALALLVSGGHTELVLVEDFGKYKIIGRTHDDAVGEAFDKVARMLGLPYPGGPEISKLAKRHREIGTESLYKFPRPMIHSKDLNFSFSGLKTAVLYKLKSLENIDSDTRENIAHAFEDAAVDVLIEKTRQAIELHNEVRTLIIAGGVSANRYLQEEAAKLVQKFPHIELKIPDISLSTDNAIMIGIAAYITSHESRVPHSTVSIKATGNLTLGK